VKKMPPIQLMDELKMVMLPGQVISDAVELLTYQMDAALDRGYPDGVVMAQTENDVVRVIEWAKKMNTAAIARGAGTGLSGGSVPEHGGVILGFARMNQILELDKEGRSIIAEAGVVNQTLDEYVKKFGLYYPPDPASGRSSTIGGNVAENAGGPHCFKYGVTTNYITGMDIVSADGKLIRLGGRALDYPEYDFISLITGSEGTLAVLLRVMFRLLRNPPALKTMMAAFDTVEEAGNAVSAIISHGLIPATMEFMDQKMMGIIEDYAHAGLPVQAGAALIIEVDGYAESLSHQMDEIKEILKGYTKWEVRSAASAEEREKIWYGRKSAVGAMARLSPGYLLLDGTVPRSKLARTLSAITRVCEERHLQVAYVFHAGDGNLHPFILIEDPEDEELIRRVMDTGAQVMKICVDEGGSITGEHGIGIGKRPFIDLNFNDDEMSAMQEIKEIFDPQNILNPGKIFHLRPRQRRRKDSTEAGVDLAPKSAEAAARTIYSLVSSEKAVVIQGAGTKVNVNHPGAETLSTQALAGVVDYALPDLYISVGAGTSIAQLQAVLAEDKMWTPVISPWPQATIGGVLATNFNAPLRLKYGSLRDNLLAVKVVLPDGRIGRFGKPVVKNVAGYDLPKLFVGSYGTLGLLTEVTLKITPLPRKRINLLLPLDNLSDGLVWGKVLLQKCLTASSLVLCDGADLAGSPYVLMYTLEGLLEDVEAEIEQVGRVLEDAGLRDRMTTLAETSASDLWANWIRAGLSTNGIGKATSLFRIGLPPSTLGLYNAEAKLEQAGLESFIDIANGLIYLIGSIDHQPLQAQAKRMGGYAIYAAGRRPTDHAWGYLPESISLMKNLKNRWDPLNLFNAGVFIV
jgi:D-lactate dehydrogenase (cytochrome)